MSKDASTRPEPKSLYALLSGRIFVGGLAVFLGMAVVYAIVLWLIAGARVDAMLESGASARATLIDADLAIAKREVTDQAALASMLGVEERAALQDRAGLALERSPRLSGLALTDRDGNVLFGRVRGEPVGESRLDGRTISVFDRSYFSEARDQGGLVVASPVLSRPSAVPTIPIAAPWYRAGEFGGLVFGSVYIENLLGSLPRERRATGDQLIVDAHGQILAHLTAEGTLAELGERGVQLEVDAGAMGISSGTLRVGSGPSKPFVGSALKETPGWSLLVAARPDGRTEAIVPLMMGFAWVLLLGLVGLWGLAVSIARGVSQPVSELAERLGDSLPGELPNWRTVAGSADQPLEIQRILHAIEALAEWSASEQSRSHAVEDQMRMMNALLSEELHSREAMIEQRTSQLQRALTEATASTQAKVRLLANTSHELRTPLNGIIGRAELLLLGNPEQGTRQQLEVILHSAEGMQQVVGDLLTMSELGTKGFELRLAPFYLMSELDQVIESATSQARAKGLHLIGSIDRSMQGRRLGDRYRLRQVLQNLVTNAVKFTDSGEVRISAQPVDGDRVELIVADTGIGIAMADQARIFEPFGQVDSSYSRIAGGAGLGLTISRELVERMSGSLTMDSQLGRGSTFRVELPLPIVTEDGAAARAPPPPVAGEIRFRALRALVVDDAPVNAEVLSSQLRALGLIDPAVAADGFSAFEFLLQNPCDIVFLDCQMPGMDGYEVAETIRRKMPDRTLTIIGVTAHTQLGDRQRCLDAGMDDYLPKPIRLALLRAAIERSLADV